MQRDSEVWILAAGIAVLIAVLFLQGVLLADILSGAAAARQSSAEISPVLAKLLFARIH